MSRARFYAPRNPRGHGPRAVVLVAVALLAAVSGCQSLCEDLSMCSIPPNYSCDFAPPSCYGHYPTLWRPWPCNAEAAPEEAEGRKAEEGGEAKGEAEEMPPPSEGQMPGDVFEAPTVPPESQPPETEPFLPPTEQPGETPRTPDIFTPTPTEPPAEKPPSAEPLPERLVPDQPGAEPPATEPSATPPGHGRWNMNSLPSDAPEGGLVQDGPDAGGKSVPPSLLVPDDGLPGRGPKSKRVQNAARPGAVRGTSATEAESRKPGRRAATEAAAQLIPVVDETSQGPKLLGETQGRHVPTSSRGQSARKSQSIPAAAPADETTAPASASGWRPSQSRGAAVRSTSDEAWQKLPTAGNYPGRQTSYAAPVAPAAAAQPEYTAGGSANPLR